MSATALLAHLNLFVEIFNDHFALTFFVLKLKDMDVNYMWFQEDDATCHTARETIKLLHEPLSCNFRFGNQNYPCRSCDLMPLDFFSKFFEV